MFNINVREYNLETNETNLFIEKNNTIIMMSKEMKINSYKSTYLILVFIIIISFINVFIFWRKKNRKKNIEEYNKYYEI